MKQTEFWKSKSERTIKSRPNNFALRSFSLIRKRKLKNLLDLGCGRSKDPIFFAKKGLNVIAVDVSKNRIKAVQKEINQQKIKNIKLIYKDIRKLDFPDNSFDVIYAHLILHYFDNKITTRIFDNLYRILKKNGLMFIKCKSTDDPEYGKGKRIEENVYLLGKHLRHFFNQDYMKQKLNKFKILKIRKTSSKYIEHKLRSKYIEAIATK